MESWIESVYKIGDKVIKYPSTLDRAAKKNGVTKKIKSFCKFGGVDCVRFEGSNIPHSIECISPV